MGIGTPEIFGADFDRFMLQQHEALRPLAEQIAR